MPELKNSNNKPVEVPEVKDFQYGIGYLMAKIAELCRQASQPVDIQKQEEVDARNELVKRLARLQKMRDIDKS